MEMESTTTPRRAGRPGALHRAMVVLLVGLNLVLLAVLVSATNRMPAAFAQAGLRPGDFVCVTAKPLGQSYDLLYVLDVAERKLHAVYPVGAQTPQLRAIPPRTLAQDFGRRVP